MAKNEDAKAGVLAAAGVVLLLVLLPEELRRECGVSIGHGGLWRRMAYSFVHAGWIHALVNVWCLLGVVFLLEVGKWRLLCGLVVAVAVPTFVLTAEPTVGLSTVCYFLLGSVWRQVGRNVWWHCWILALIVAGLLMPMVNGWIHVWGYGWGLLWGLMGDEKIKIR